MLGRTQLQDPDFVNLRVSEAGAAAGAQQVLEIRKQGDNALVIGGVSSGPAFWLPAASVHVCLAGRACM